MPPRTVNASRPTASAAPRHRCSRLGATALAALGVLGASGCGARASTSNPLSSALTAPPAESAAATVPADGDAAAAAAPSESGDAAPTTGASGVPQAKAPAATAGRIDGPAVATTEAERRLDVEVGATCDLALVQALASRHPGVEQFVTVAADSWTSTTARLELAGFDGTRWVCQTGAKVAMVGSSGTRPLLDRRSGDGTTPAGVFPLGTQTAWDGQQFQFFGNSPDPGVRGTYRAVQQADCWGATPGAATYQRLYERANCPGPDDEWLPRFADVYSNAAVIGANLAKVSGDAPGEPAYAAAIFLHRHNYAGGTQPRPTSGCVSLAAPDLLAVLRSLDPELNPQFAIGERTWLTTTA